MAVKASVVIFKQALTKLEGDHQYKHFVLPDQCRQLSGQRQPSVCNKLPVRYPAARGIDFQLLALSHKSQLAPSERWPGRESFSFQKAPGLRPTQKPLVFLHTFNNFYCIQVVTCPMLEKHLSKVLCWTWGVLKVSFFLKFSLRF